MSKTKTPTHHLQIPIDGSDVAAHARRMRKHLTILQKMAMISLREPDDFEIPEMEALRATTELLIALQRIEEDAVKSQSPP